MLSTGNISRIGTPSRCHESLGPAFKSIVNVSFRSLHASTRQQAVKPFLLADIGEGITECEVIQW
jgi:2-oxoisovalerate dehydrogenase E2 component (dihydrolipoyl transacylase)